MEHRQSFNKLSYNQAFSELYIHWTHQMARILKLVQVVANTKVDIHRKLH